MQKTFTITLNKIIFYIEEQAYQILKEYLDSIKNHFSAEDAEEILADMESSIADKFSEKTSGAEKVITKVDVLELVKAMGSIEDISEEVDGSISSQNEESKKDEKSETRKLYRNPEDAVIAGVCSGLAAYFNIDSVVVRVLFAISVFFGGTGVIAYLILWIAMPEAKTSAQKLEMKGDPVTLKTIGEIIRGKAEEYKKNNPSKRIGSIISRFIKLIFFVFKKIFEISWHVLRYIIGISLLLTAVFTIFSLSVSLGVLLFGAGSMNGGFTLIEVINTVPHYYIFVNVVFLVMVIPIVSLLLGSIALLKKKSVMSGMFWSVLFGVWMFSLVVLGVMFVNVFPNLGKAIDKYKSSEVAQMTSKSYELKDFSKISIHDSLEAVVTYGKEYKVVANGTKQDLENIQIIVDDGTLDVANGDWRQRQFCFGLCFFDSVKLEITLPKLDRLELSGASEAMLNKFDSDKLEIRLFGASTLDGEVKAKELFLDLSGSSETTLKGEVKKFSIEGSGVSSVSAFDLSADSVSLNLSGASSVDIGISNTIDASLSGASEVQYFGNPKVNEDLSGASEINKYGVE